VLRKKHGALKNAFIATSVYGIIFSGKTAPFGAWIRAAGVLTSSMPMKTILGTGNGKKLKTLVSPKEEKTIFTNNCKTCEPAPALAVSINHFY
jgi:hypothetical protein